MRQNNRPFPVPVEEAADAIDAQIMGAASLIRVRPTLEEMRADVPRLLMLANLNMKHAGLRTCMMAALFGRHEIFRHEGKFHRVTFWRNRPFLLSSKKRNP